MPTGHNWICRELAIRFCEGIYYSKCNDLFFCEGAVTRDDRILSICVSVGTKCNLKCAVCIANSRPDGKFMDATVARTLLRRLSTLTPLRLVWSGGEPTLYPSLPEILEDALQLGFHNVVATNALARDRLYHLRGAFSYAVSIYGTDPRGYEQYTGRDALRAFRNRFEELVSAGHLVSAYFRLDARWRQALPRVLEWLAPYPLQKLVLVTTIQKGRLDSISRPLSAEELVRARLILGTVRCKFPIVFPTAATPRARSFGNIVIDELRGSPDRASVNGETYLLTSSFSGVLGPLARNNQKLFTMGDYFPPSVS